MSISKVLLYVGAGAAVGAVFGVLFAPAKGSITKKKLARKSADYVEDIREKLNEYVDVVNEEFDSLKEETMDLVDKGKKKVSSAAAAKHFK